MPVTTSSRLEKRIDEVLALAAERPPIASLAATMALEHYTAILAAEILQDPLTLKGADRESAAMWRWHAIEEIEHKGVAFDTWRHATKDWSRWKRWKIKTLMMLVITTKFWRHRIEGALILLAQDGITGWKAYRGLAWHLIGKPGLLRKVFVPWLVYFLPGFHPWNHDDRALIGKAESDYAEARMAAA
jgi:predicted metal-dependent hydrolase